MFRKRAILLAEPGLGLADSMSADGTPADTFGAAVSVAAAVSEDAAPADALGGPAQGVEALVAAATASEAHAALVAAVSALLADGNAAALWQATTAGEFVGNFTATLTAQSQIALAASVAESLEADGSPAETHDGLAQVLADLLADAAPGELMERQVTIPFDWSADGAPGETEDAAAQAAGQVLANVLAQAVIDAGFQTGASFSADGAPGAAFTNPGGGHLTATIFSVSTIRAKIRRGP